MNFPKFSDETKNKIFIILILIIILIILYIFTILKNKSYSNDNNAECNCAVIPSKKQEIKHVQMQEQMQEIKQMPKQNQPKNILALYYTEWCGHSKNFMPEWKKIKATIESSELGNKVECREYNCDVAGDKKTCSEYGVRGFPTVLLHTSNDNVVPFEDRREMDVVLNFVKKHI